MINTQIRIHMYESIIVCMHVLHDFICLCVSWIGGISVFTMQLFKWPLVGIQDIFCISHNFWLIRKFYWMLKNTFVCISHHFRSVSNFNFVWEIIFKMTEAINFGMSKTTCLLIYNHFRSIDNLYLHINTVMYLFQDMATSRHFGWRKPLSDLFTHTGICIYVYGIYTWIFRKSVLL